MRTTHLRGAKPSVHLVHEDRATANNAVIMGDSRCLPNMLNSYKLKIYLLALSGGSLDKLWFAKR
jgi:hypothetical protein